MKSFLVMCYKLFEVIQKKIGVPLIWCMIRGGTEKNRSLELRNNLGMLQLLANNMLKVVESNEKMKLLT